MILYSDKFKACGTIEFNDIYYTLRFEHNERQYKFALRFGIDENIAEKALMIMESCIENITAPHKQKTCLYNWSVKGILAHGNVTGHKRLADTTYIHTSPIQYITIDYEAEEALIRTRNTVYHCPLEHCDFEKQDEYEEFIPDYAAIKEKYKTKHNASKPTAQPGSVLLVLSNHDTYYFNSLSVVLKDSTESLPYTAHPHIGMFQDSFLIYTEDRNVGIAYFPHPHNISIYSLDTNGMPLFAENIGNSVIYINLKNMQFRLAAGERKKLCEKNAENKKTLLPDGDLYPAAIV